MFTLLQDYSDYSNPYSGMPTWFWIFYLALIIVLVIGMWKAFEKAGEPGWAAIVPIYNLYTICKIAKRMDLWRYMLIAVGGYILGFILMMMSPMLGGILLGVAGIALFVLSIMVNLDVAKNYGQSSLFGVGLAFLGFIFWPILGFGDAKYIGKMTDLDRDIDNLGKNQF